MVEERRRGNHAEHSNCPMASRQGAKTALNCANDSVVVGQRRRLAAQGKLDMKSLRSYWHVYLVGWPVRKPLEASGTQATTLDSSAERLHQSCLAFRGFGWIPLCLAFRQRPLEAVAHLSALRSSLWRLLCFERTSNQLLPVSGPPAHLFTGRDVP